MSFRLASLLSVAATLVLLCCCCNNNDNNNRNNSSGREWRGCRMVCQLQQKSTAVIALPPFPPTKSVPWRRRKNIKTHQLIMHDPIAAQMDESGHSGYLCRYDTAIPTLG